MSLRVKHILDKFIAALGLIVLIIPLTILTILLAIYYRGNPFYITERAGLYGHPFKLYKYKSMKMLYDENGELLSDEERITTVGKILRKLSIDELPQLINVLNGTMSIVGPRPLLLEYNELYSDYERQRLLMRPGITGWAQVNGRNNIDWKKKFAMDVEYVTNYSLLFDLKIVILTVVVIFKREGISQDGYVSAEKFRG
ncbi:sugar transferase [Listeria floridensis FSL S10-1187]|uniref:Sugar transferase n=1 Tax=Listeria floridensis FSL S10-1187 TaxID=1265817 RepID=A0ABN0RE90_9LIST|nr:sugar transferase [Listeria floridensis]EUJ30971.1 sugar transferase [Listeria floridensis FSL S10-1187]